MGALSQSLNRLPLFPILLIGLLYLGYGFYDWSHSPQSELGQKRVQLKQSRENLAKTKEKLKAAEEFFARLEVLRSTIRSLSTQLDSTKIMFGADIDVANFVRMVGLEAKKLGITITKMSPDTEIVRDYYVEVPFSLSVRGAFVQMLVFFDRIARFQQITKVGSFEMKPTGTAYTKYVELEGSMKVLAYKYKGTTADQIATKPEMTGNVLQTNEQGEGAGASPESSAEGAGQ